MYSDIIKTSYVYKHDQYRKFSFTWMGKIFSVRTYTINVLFIHVIL